jgi:hypothetical protein
MEAGHDHSNRDEVEKEELPLPYTVSNLLEKKPHETIPSLFLNQLKSYKKAVAVKTNVVATELEFK